MDEPPPAGPRVTLKAIARKLRLSHVTVSLALHNHPKIPESRRQQIQQAAHEMGYLPNAVAVALSQHRRTAKEQRIQPWLAWVEFVDKFAGTQPMPGRTAYWRAASQEAERLGYGLEMFGLPVDISFASLAEALGDCNVVGLLFAPRRASAVAMQSLPAGIFPAVCLGPFEAMSTVRLVTNDNISDVTTAFESVWTKGYRRIGLIVDSTPGSALCQAGFIHARTKRMCAPASPILELSEQGPKKMVDWFRRHRPDALLFEHQGLLQRLEADVPLPVDLGVALLDVPLNGPQRFAGIRRNEAEIGRVAVRTLATQINDGVSGGTQSFCHVLIESEWVDGPSLPMRP